MSDTPRTDGMTFVAQIGMMPPYDTVPSEFARQLERELNAAVDALKLCSAVIGAPNDEEWKSVDECDAAFNAATAVIKAAKG